MTSISSCQNSITLFPASFCTPKPNISVTPSISWLPTFAFQSIWLLAIWSLVPLPFLNPAWTSGSSSFWKVPSFVFHIMKKTSFLVLVLEGLVGLHRTVQLQLLQHYWLGHRLGLLWYWMVCFGNKQIILSFLRLHPSTAFWTLVVYDGYSISSKGFLPTVVDIMVIWVKFIYSSPF